MSFGLFTIQRTVRRGHVSKFLETSRQIVRLQDPLHDNDTFIPSAPQRSTFSVLCG